MPVSIRQGITATVSQQQTLTVQQQQSLKLLQYSGVELESELNKMLLDNPMLELDLNNGFDETNQGQGESDSLLEYANTEAEDFSMYQSTFDEDDYTPEIIATISLQDYLLEQLSTSDVDDFQKSLVSYLIGDLDDNGYLSSDLAELTTLVSEELDKDVSLTELQYALRILQSFEPSGIGARNLAECLLLQLDDDILTLSLDIDEGIIEKARQICKRGFAGLEALAKADVQQLLTWLETDIESIRQVHHLIQQLNPKPGRLYSSKEADFAIPDLLCRYVEGKWELVLNPQVLPKLRIQPDYERVIKVMDKKRLAENAAMNEQLKQARLFMLQLNQRFATILMVGQAILQEQYAFFEHGLSALKPLTLKVIADQLSLHESTISRAVNQKFIATPHGIFELKRFFTNAIATQEGEDASAASVQLKIKQLIEQENKAKPLSDSKLVNLLEKQGIVIARRTVAKYREGMNIPATSIRKAQALLSGSE